MRFCTHCGSDLGQSQAFCVNCGTPVRADVSTSTPAPSPALPPLATAPTPPPSFSAVSVPPPRPAHPAASFPPPYPSLPPPAPWVDTHQTAPAPLEAPANAPWENPPARRRSIAPILAAAIVVLLLAVGGGVYLLNKPNNTIAIGKTGGRGAGVSPSIAPSIAAPTSPSTTDPTIDPTVTPTGPTVPTGPTPDLTATLAASAPTQAKDNVDAANNPVSYSPQNMVDGVGSTCWRTPGDATGQTLTFTLPTASVIGSVGLINGYAKIDPTSGDDRYVQERRITAVTWLFDDGTNVPQLLNDGVRTMQSVSVPGTNVQSRTVRLRIDGTTSPGSTLDFTAVSDVSVQGR